MPAQQRLFFAVWPSLDQVVEIVTGLSPVRAVSPEWLRWQPPQRWHITVAFLGKENDELVQRARRAAHALVGGVAPTPVVVSGAGTFGPVLWAGVETGDWLGVLARALNRSLQTADRDRRFRPHVTLARARNHRIPAGTTSAVDQVRTSAHTPEELTLVRSWIGPEPRYEVIDRFRFGGRTP